MQNIFIYFLKVNLAVALLYFVYRLFLSKNISFAIKRFYLLGSLLLAFVLPFVSISLDFSGSIIQVEETLDFHGFEQLNKIQFLPTSETVSSSNQFNSISIALVIYFFIGAFVLSFAFFDLSKIFRNIKRNEKINQGRLKFIINKKFSSPFSFFNFIFTKSVKNIKHTPEYVHELAHVRQLHSIDRLLVEFLTPLLWINPFIYLFKKSLIEVHEHLADAAVLKNGVEPADYQKYLFLQLKSGQYLKMTSNFSYSLTKKRITMISKNISKRKTVVRTVVSLAIVASIFVFYGFNNQKLEATVLKIENQSIVNDISDPVPSILPLKVGSDCWIGAHYGMRMHPILGYKRKHIGIDITADRGTEVVATADGEVLRADYAGGYGNCVRIKHNEQFETRYGHLQKFNVKAGDKVKKGDVIGYVGATGLATSPHVHYEVLKEDKYVDPADYINNIKEIPLKKK